MNDGNYQQNETAIYPIIKPEGPHIFDEVF